MVGEKTKSKIRYRKNRAPRVPRRRRPLHAHMLPLVVLSYHATPVHHLSNPRPLCPLALLSFSTPSSQPFAYSSSLNRLTRHPCNFDPVYLSTLFPADWDTRPRIHARVAYVARVVCGLAQPRRTSRNMCTMKYTQKCLPATYVCILFLRSLPFGGERARSRSRDGARVLWHAYTAPPLHPRLYTLWLFQQEGDLQYR